MAQGCEFTKFFVEDLVILNDILNHID